MFPTEIIMETNVFPAPRMVPIKTWWIGIAM